MFKKIKIITYAAEKKGVNGGRKTLRKTLHLVHQGKVNTKLFRVNYRHEGF